MHLTEALEQLQKQVFAIQPLTEAEWNAFSAIWQPFEAKRKAILTSAGETENHLYFVTEGVQRAFYEHQDKDVTIMFSYPYSFSGVADSFLTRRTSAYFLETLTPSCFIKTSFAQLEPLLLRHHNLETFIRKITSHALAGALERQIELQAFSAEQKFKTLLSRSPQVLKLIPHKYLASYLGLDATTFSKLLGSVRL